MRIRGLVAGIALGSFLGAACGGDDGGDPPVDGPGAIDAPPPDAPPPIDARPGVRTIFMNRAGGDYTRGEANDSVANTIGFADDATAPPYPYGDDAWTATIACVAAIFAPFDVTVTDVDPGAVDHVELVMTTTPGVFGFPNGVGSIAPADAECTLLERGLALVFAGVYGAGATQDVCESAASMAGILYGLDWARHCPDVMTYLSGCGAKAFRDVDAACGEFEARDCRCGGTTQNTYQFLSDRLGLR